MKFVHKRILLCTLLFTFSLTSHGQDMGNVGFRAGYTMPTGILGTLLKPGVGFGIQFNSTYAFQVRKRFTIDYAKSESSGISIFSKMFDYNLYEQTTAIFKLNSLTSIDATFGLDYKILPEKLPWFYCGPEIMMGIDQAKTEYVSNSSGYIELNNQGFLHTAFKLNFGFEKSFGPINVFGEYAIMRFMTEYYDINAQDLPNGGIYHFINHKFTVGIKF